MTIAGVANTLVDAGQRAGHEMPVAGDRYWVGYLRTALTY